MHKKLSSKSQEALIFPNLTNESLISVGQLCDDNCEVVFDKNKVNVIKNEEIIIQGTRNKSDGLYDLQINQEDQNCEHKINYIITKDKSKL